MAEAVYFLCALTSATCTFLLWMSYSKSGLPLLFWSALCFAGLAVNNLLLLTDLVLKPELDFSIPRNLVGVIAISLLLYGVLWSRDSRRKDLP